MSITKACSFLNDKMPEDGDIEDVLDEFRLTGEQVFKDIQKALSNRKTTSTGLGQFLMNVDDDDQSNEKENQSTTNGRGSRASKAFTSKSTVIKTAANKKKVQQSKWIK